MRIILRIEYSFLTLFSGECENDGNKIERYSEFDVFGKCKKYLNREKFEVGSRFELLYAVLQTAA